jgi:beta-N-acetylhexosaminidase
VRGEIGFDGLLMSDDLSMKALSGSFAERAAAALAAGCDVVLHCNGDMGEMQGVMAGTGALEGHPADRAAAALARIAGGPEPFDEEAGRARFEAALAGVWTPGARAS